MKKHPFSRKVLFWTLQICFLFGFYACSEESVSEEIDNANATNVDGSSTGNINNETSIIFLLIDEESIDNGNEPNDFSETDVNDQLATIGLRQQLQYFKENVGQTIDLFTGQVGDEGWHAPTEIPNSWITAGPTENGLQNYLEPGPGLGAGDDDPEVLLDQIPDVIPLRATGLAMLKGQVIFATVYDSDISTNYSPITANLQGDNLGIVAFEVLDVQERTDGSDSDLPKVTIQIMDADEVKNDALFLFENTPVPESSSEPEDTVPPTSVPEIALKKAD